MNPLRYRLPQQRQNNINALQPQPSALAAWIAAQPTINLQSTASLAFRLLQSYNRCKMPAAMRLNAMITLQPVINSIIEQLRSHYQNEPLPLRKNARTHANMAARFLDEAAFAYKTTVADAVIDAENNEMSINLFIASLRLTIDHLGYQLLECYSQFSPPVNGLWGEIHRTYQLAERNGLHTRVLTENGNEANAPAGNHKESTPGYAKTPFMTVQHGYLRLVLLALATPNHLMPGQATQIYTCLEKWTAGCRLFSKKITEAKTGDIVIDLAGERPPAVATGYARFRPVDGRFLDISKLQEKLDEISASVDEQHQAKHVPLTIVERLRRDLLTRLRKAWQGRAERAYLREEDMNTHMLLCMGLDMCHHFISNESNFHPEQDEIQYHRPQEASSGLTLAPADALTLESPGSTNQQGRDITRVSRFTEGVDVWDAIHETEIHAREKREAAMAHFRAEPWLRLNHSAAGLALRRLPKTQSRTRVGAVVAFRNTNDEPWTVGVLRWLQDTPGKTFDIGIMTLSTHNTPVAVRAIGGAGAGGEYFRSLLIQPAFLEKQNVMEFALLVPASIYDVGTQLVLNRQTELEYVRLTRMIDTSSSFSLFEFKHIEAPPAEQARISKLSQSS
ncbi:MAG TPA: hypothetical protein ENK04_00125 [Gammaproteobacteria bacterium]|nr:hypothetical protein [Gammaproteobacteria bacterium]